MYNMYGILLFPRPIFFLFFIIIHDSSSSAPWNAEMIKLVYRVLRDAPDLFYPVIPGITLSKKR